MKSEDIIEEIKKQSKDTILKYLKKGVRIPSLMSFIRKD